MAVPSSSKVSGASARSLKRFNDEDRDDTSMKKTRCTEFQNEKKLEQASKSESTKSAAFDIQDALDNSSFAKVPFEIRNMILEHALISQKPVDELNPQTYTNISPQIGEACKLFKAEGKPIYYSQNEFYIRDSYGLQLFAKSNKDYLHHIRNVNLLKSHIAYDLLSCLDLYHLCNFSGLKTLTITLEWHHYISMISLMKSTFKYVKDTLASRKICIERLNVVSKPIKERGHWFEVNRLVKLITVFGTSKNGLMCMNHVPVVLGQNDEIYKPGSEVFKAYTASAKEDK